MLVDSSLSVIIPAYQAEKTIARAIKSVLTIDVDSLEVIVVMMGQPTLLQRWFAASFHSISASI